MCNQTLLCATPAANPYMEAGQPCVHCDEPTAFGFGRFINRIPADAESERDDGSIEYRDGYACAECMTTECDRCDQTIGMDEDITCGDINEDGSEFSDGAYRVCFNCLTPTEHSLLEAA